MHLSGRPFATAVAASAALAPTAAYPACALADLAGKWQAYSVGWDGIQANWARCTMTVDAAGKITGGSCTTSDTTTGNVRNGSFTLQAANSCTFAGKFTFAGAVNRLRHMTLPRDKQTANGVGTFGGPGTFVFSLTKI